MERRDVFENEFTEEERKNNGEDAAESLKLDPDVDSQDDDAP